jgi:DNA-binding CsgD family transcriptional regulator
MAPAFLGFLALALGSFVTAGMAHRLLERFAEPFLWSYTLFLGFWTAFALLLVMQYILAPLVLPTRFLARLTLANGPLVFLVLATSLFFLVSAAGEIIGRPPARWLKLAYAGVWGAVLVAAALLVDPGSDALPSAISPVAGLLKITTVLGSVLVMVIGARGLRDRQWRTGVRAFAGVFFAGFVVYSLVLVLLGDSRLHAWATAAVQIGFSVPALVLLQRVLASRAERQSLTRGDDDGLEALAASLGLSKRESEIVGLLLRGSSNKEIMVALGVSMETVKKHVYNTYRKLGVRSRLQLVVLVRDRLAPSAR